ncbi:MAG: FKBP-type peptidyl-prolyl cis-trans isomerase [Prevotellaceae bacterium]|nr:FKBP-type peptidyl-prolyl cis-trans isomerase [Prevotellaceae bacterium]
MIKRLILALCVVTLACGCKEDFSVWKEANVAWLEANKANLGQDDDIVKSFISPTGLQCEIYHRGYGQTPKTASYVYLTYSGWLIDGTRVEHIQEQWVTVSDLIATCSFWREILPEMPQGSRLKVYVPESLGYGEAGTKSISAFVTPPYSTLIFDIEILDVSQVDPSTI